MRWILCIPSNAPLWTGRWHRWLRCSCVIAALAISACSSGPPPQPAPISILMEPPVRVPSHLRQPCPAVLPTPDSDTGEAVMRAWLKAARTYHRCRQEKAALALAVASYEQTVEQAYCRALVAARQGVCAD